MATFQDYSPDWWQEVLRGFEPAQYYSSPVGMQFGSRSPSRQRYFQDSYQDTLKDYYQQAGTAMRGGQAPTSFMDYLETNPWTARYSSLPQTARGVTGMAANPRTRFLFNY
tara:strand:+ start:3219 stop:3551 length:333 start_codon:yes stop_codon:yes gene_type:complete